MTDSEAAPHSASTKRLQTRTLRERKQRKLYSEEWALGDDEAVEGGRGFSLADKLESPRFEHPSMIKEMAGADLTVSYLQRHGFNTPLLFKDKNGLGIRVPTANFTISDVRMCVGSRRLLDVMDVNTQKNIEMTMKEWQRYYEDPNKERLLNVISLEFSHTRLENYIQSPSIVRQVDWVDSVWPRHLKEQQVESTNLLEDMMYPKVQKYCLMSVKGCFTDFHVDFGGTSVWYHILKGAKVFWLIPPTDENLQLYEKWVLSGKQSDVFFGDTVEKCVRVHLQAGNTFFIPTGWIHAVYTPSDSLVFGGNFLHSFGIEKQLKIAQAEDITKVPQKFRYPFFTEMLWYVLERYVNVLLGRSHLLPINEPSVDEENSSKDNDIKMSDGKDIDGDEIKIKREENIELKTNVNSEKPLEVVSPTKHVHLTQQELHGLKAIVMYLHQLPGNRKNVPDLLGNPIALIRDVRTLVERHRHDSREAAITGIPVLQCYDDILNERAKKQGFGKCSLTRGPRGNYKKQLPTAPPVLVEKVDKNGAPRRRRTRCKKCEACQRSDCGECVFCQDMVKFGGPGRAKQTCNMRQCLQPMLPVTASCIICHLDGWMQTPIAPQTKGNIGRTGSSALMECAICYSITHPSCVGHGGSAPSDDLPNSWECPQCTNMGLNVDYKPRHFRARQKSSEIRRMSISSDGSSIQPQRSSISILEPPLREVKQEDDDIQLKLEDEPSSPVSGKNSEISPSNMVCNMDTSLEAKRRRTTEVGDKSSCGSVLESDPPRKSAVRAQLAQQLCSNSTKVLKKPQYPVRPAQLNTQSTLSNGGPLCLDRTCMISVFRFLSTSELAICALVCKTWAGYTVDPVLWRNMSFVQCRLTAAHLAGIARRQPLSLSLEWSTLARRQLSWLISRLPALRSLSLAGSAAASAMALRTCCCPPLQSLDLSFCPGMSDSCLRDLLSPPQDSRPGLTGSSTRLRNLKVLCLAGTDITDVSMRYVTQALPVLNELDLSSCARVTDAGIAQLASTRCLERLSLAGCRLLTETALDHLSTVQNLVRLDLRHVPLVSTQAVIKFAAKSKHNLHVKDVKLVDRRKTK